MIIILDEKVISNSEIKSHCSEEIYKQVLKTSKEIDDYIEDILESVYDDKISISK